MLALYDIRLHWQCAMGHAGHCLLSIEVLEDLLSKATASLADLRKAPRDQIYSSLTRLVQRDVPEGGA